MDLDMPELDGLAATRLISAELPSVKVVILTASLGLSLHYELDARHGQHAAPANAAVIEHTERRVQFADAAPHIKDVETVVRVRARRRFAEDQLTRPLCEL